MAVLTHAAAGRGRQSPRISSQTVLGVAAFGAFLAFLDATIVNVAFPDIRASFPAAGLGTLSWVLNAYNIVFAAFLIPCGRLADLFGRRRMFAFGVGLFALASVACALAPSVELLVAARMVQALGSATLVPASLALVVQAFPEERRTHAVGLWGASAALASGLGPPIGGALVQAGGWRWAFLVNIPFGAAALLAARRSLVESRSPGRRTLPDLRGAVLLAAGLGLLTLGIVQGNDWGWASARVIGSLVAAVLLGGAFVASSRAHRSPLLDPALLRIRPFAVGNAATAVAGMGFYAYLLTNILWLTYVWRYDILQAGLALVPGALVAAVVAAVLGPLADRHGYRLFVVPGALVWALAYVWYVEQVGVHPAFLTQWLPGQVLSGLGVGATLPLLGSAALGAVPGGRYATASAVVSSTRQLGGVLGIAVLVVLIGTPSAATAVDDLHRGWWLSVACFAACAAVGLFLGAVRPAVEDAVDAGSREVRVSLPEQRSADPGEASVDATPLFRRLPEASRSALAEAAVRRPVLAGDWLIRAGDAATSMFVVRTGRFDVVVDDQVVRELGPGSVVGELALLAGGVRSASIRARRDSTVLEISREQFEAAMGRHPTAYADLATVLAEQLSAAAPAARASSDGTTVVAVLGLHPGARVDEAAAALVGATHASVRTVLLDAPEAHALENAERDARLVLATAAYGTAAWDFGLRHADRVVLVADAGHDPASMTSEVAAGADLLLLGAHPGHERLRDWALRLRPWQVTVARDLPTAGDLRALGARLTGTSVGLVLGGGGARAMAHIGVLAELATAGVYVDRVAGTSIGAVIAALHAVGNDPEAIHDICYREFVRTSPFGDYRIPTVALARGQRLRRAVGRHLGGHEITGLPHLFRAVSVDLLRRTPVVHRAGELSDAVVASVALPVLLPPHRIGDQVLVDGGVLDNVPVGALRERDEGPLLAVNIAMGGGGPRPGPAGGAPRPPRMPTLGETLLRTMMIGSGGAVDAAREQGVAVLTPPTMGVGLLEFHQLDTMVEAGRAATRQLLEQTGGVFPAVT